jgi:hypothetical protein
VKRRIISIGALFVGACLVWLWLADGAATKPADSGTAEARVEVMYPPAFDQIAPAAAATGPLGPLEADLCGYGRVNTEQIPESLEAEADVAILRVVGDFERSSDDRKHALGLSMRALLEAEAVDRRLTAEDPQNCRANALCEERLNAAFVGAATPSIEELVRLAASTRNPQTYVMAMRACRSILVDAPPTGCSALSNDQWAQLDPDNVLPWLMKARAARQRKDTDAFEEALLRASRAKVFDRRATHYAELLASADGREQSVRALIVSRLLAAESREDPAEYFSNFTMFSLYCGKADRPEQREVCVDLARLLMERSADRIGVEVGLELDRINLMQAGRFGSGPALRRGLPANPITPPNRSNSLSCKDSAQAEEWLRDLSQNGEVGYLRELAAKKVTSSAKGPPTDAPTRQRTPPGSR